MFRFFPVFLATVVSGVSQIGDARPFSQSKTINFYHEVASRDLTGLAIRSDGRIINGPTLTPLPGSPIADLWWDWEPLTAREGIVGTGPNGTLLRVTLAEDHQSYAAETWAQTDANHIFSVKRLPRPKLVVAGTTPDATLYVWNEAGEELARARLPADSILDILPNETGSTIWVATGNPGTLFAVDLDTLIKAEPGADLTNRGITLCGKIRDRNIRQLAWSPTGQILAGSAPSGNLYEFPPEGGDPIILLDQESGEVTDILVEANADIYVSVVAAEGNSSRRVIKTANVKSAAEDDTEKKQDANSPAASIPEPIPVEKFSGRSSLFLIPGGTGLPESLSGRNNLAIYQILRHEDIYLLPGGDDGELAGYDPEARRAISFAGSHSAQITEVTPRGTDGSYLVMTNNPAGLSLLDFRGPQARVAKTERVNLLTPSTIGALRFNRIRNIDTKDVAVKMRANRGRDSREGWSPWVTALPRHGGWLAPGLTGQFVEIEFAIPATADPDTELDLAELFYTPQNRRPVLQSFRLVSPNFGLNYRDHSSRPAPLLTLGQVVGMSPAPSTSGADENRQALMASQVVPRPGAQVVMWTVSDADGDRLTATFSVRQAGAEHWTDLAINLQERWFQFDRTTLAEGVYFTRLTVSEQAPRLESDRHVVSFETDDLVIDLTPPVIDEVNLALKAGLLEASVTVMDERSRVAGVRLEFNNGFKLELAQPADGVLDSPVETFHTSIRQEDLGAATSVDIYTEDLAGNVATKRVPLP